MAYPTDLQDLNAGIGNHGDPLSSPNHIDQHTAEASVIEALEAKVGVDSSTVKTTIDYKLSGIPTDDKAVSLTGTEVLTNKTLTSPKINLGSDATGDIYYRHSDGTLKRLPVSTDGKILKLASGVPTWDTEVITSDASTTVKGVVEEATLAEIDANTDVGGTGARLFVNPSTLATSKYGKFFRGGSGEDGALSISSGTTTIDLGSASVFIKQYTTIDITGTGQLAFSNPASGGTIIIFYATGNVNITSSANPAIDVRELGASGGAGVSTVNNDGNDGTNSLLKNNVFILDGDTNSTKGTKGIKGISQGGAASTGGTVLSTFSSLYKYPNDLKYLVKSMILRGVVGAGGGSGGVTGAVNGGTADTSGAGGKGGGSLIILSAGALNFTGIINASGGAGGTASGGNATTRGGSGGGGGGGGGTVVLLANTITSESGTITASGGAGGNGSNVVNGGASGNYGGGSGGGGGGNAFASGGAGGRGGEDSNPTSDNGTAGGTAIGSGGAGGSKGSGDTGTFGAGNSYGSGGGGGGGAGGAYIVSIF